MAQQTGSSQSILITAGPTHEPIDAVRFIGNRSSGRMGTSLAVEAARRGWKVTLLMGPAAMVPTDTGIRVIRFRTCGDLQVLLREHVPHSDVLVMAAAVADYRPRVDPSFFGGKFRRTSHNLTLELEPTPDLLAEVAKTRRAEQFMVGFALEPRAEMLESARSKLHRKNVDLVVANPLETMDSENIEAVLVSKSAPDMPTPEKMSKATFAAWLMDVIDDRVKSHV